MLPVKPSKKRMTYEAAETLKATLEAAATQVVATLPQKLPLLKPV